MTTAAGKLLRLASPRYRHWRRFLVGLTLDPDLLPRPLEQPGDRDFIICGIPRSGTSLLDAVLHQPPDIATVMEPWDGMRLSPADLFRSLREEIAGSGALTRGKLDSSALDRGAVTWRREGAKTPVATQRRFLLGVKWPAFWRYLDLLPDTKFIVCVRHPCEVVASFARVGGRLSEGLEYDIAFHRSMNERLRAATRDRALRRVMLHDYIGARIAPHLGRPNVLALRYERWFSDPEGQMSDLREFLGVKLSAATVGIRVPATAVDGDLAALVRECCTTAEALGYVL